MRIEAVVFDCDGVLADTAACWQLALDDAASVVGLRLRTAQREALRGAAVTSGAHAIAAWTAAADRIPELERAIHASLMASLRHGPLEPLAGIPELLATLAAGGIPLAVASNAPVAFLDGVLERIGVHHRFTAVVSAETAGRPKPAPDPYRAACEALGADPARSVAVEDSEVGVRSARAAGLGVIGIGPDLRPDHPALLVHARSAADPRIAALLLQ
ncbi:HAD family hydrolase [Dactylosporangium sp. CA-092794]|uniref:HAD family hydrolase n=1 Tax=Dactylosporangium sp. CA-092794 TaxID=3239929 RepID=UPI003D8CE9C7